jgi:hypothetical protein
MLRPHGPFSFSLFASPAARYDCAIGSKRTNDAPAVVIWPAASFDDGDGSTDADLARLVSLGAVDTALANAPHLW